VHDAAAQMSQIFKLEQLMTQRAHSRAHGL
jgi:hypothetical protein